MNDAPGQSNKGLQATFYALSYFGSIGLIVLVRDRPGYRLLRAGIFAAVLIPLAFAFVLPHLLAPPTMPGFSFTPAAAPSAEPPPSLTSIPLVLYALVVLLVGAWKQSKEWESLKRGESWHTRSIGLTYLYKIPMLSKHARLLEENRLQRIVDPLLWLCVSFCVLYFSQALGYWLVFSSLMLLIMEETTYQKELNNILDAYDGQTEAGVIRRGLKMFSGEDAKREGTATSSDPLGDVTDSGIPTGVGRDLKAVIEQRKQRNEKRTGVESETGSTMSGAGV